MPYASDGRYFPYSDDVRSHELALKNKKTAVKKAGPRRQLSVKILEPKLEIYFESADQEQEIDATLSVTDAMALYDKLSAALVKLGEKKDAS